MDYFLVGETDGKRSLQADERVGLDLGVHTIRDRLADRFERPEGGPVADVG
jgi:hypothetical protein